VSSKPSVDRSKTTTRQEVQDPGARAGRDSSPESGVRDVDAYIASAPQAAQPLLRALREIVRSEAPGAGERPSYGMPFYEGHGRLVYFAGHQAHVGVYGLVGRAATPDELRPFVAERGTLKFAFDRPLPVAALRAAVRTRVEQNRADALAGGHQRAASPSRLEWTQEGA
jgi:uncharacterized protein YdhG (YjbR/CyaY superfamily)